MAMNSPKLYLLCTTTTIITLAYLSSPVACSLQKQPSDISKGLLFAGKTRLGSTPPSCHNKCNQCNPCLAVQVPTLPSHGGFRPTLNPAAAVPMEEYSDSSSPSSNKDSNYKPLGWKCRCHDHLFNP